MAQTKDGDKKVFKAAMDLAAAQGWRRTSLADIAEQAEVGLSELNERFGGKAGLMSALVRSVDREVLDGWKPSTAGPAEADEAGESARDRLFDVMMRRFDALGPYKAGMERIAREGGGAGPAGAVCAGCRLLNSMSWMLEAAGISSSGLVGMVRTKGLAMVYLSVLQVWFRDDTEDQSRTMARLDRALERAERFASMSGPFGGRRRYPHGETGPDAEAPA